MADRAARIDSKEATQVAGFSLSTAAIGRQRSPRIGPTFGQGSKTCYRDFSTSRWGRVQFIGLLGDRSAVHTNRVGIVGTTGDSNGKPGLDYGLYNFGSLRRPRRLARFTVIPDDTLVLCQLLE